MHLQHCKTGHIFKYLQLILFLILAGLPLQGQTLDDLLNLGLETVYELNNTVLDMTALTDAEENEIGAGVRTEIMTDKTTYSTTKFDIQAIFKKITAKAGRPDIAWECTPVTDPEFNAFAIAGGKIFLNQGLLEGLETPDELAFVIAHEVAHIELKHCVRKIQASVRASQIDPVLGEIVAVGYQLYSYPFSQTQENEADERGVTLMKAAGFDKHGAVSFFNKLELREAHYANATFEEVNDFLSTHPTAQRRRARVEQF
ncbi:MAG TPA: M48 family metallopeptidase [Candidatus Cloacimonadota bacterium]|nr:M48 family metallopeptidase [Candidatus Cloacimonadota bacterium]